MKKSDVQTFKEKLQSEVKELQRKKDYMNEHGFKHERSYISTKLKVLDSVVSNLDCVLEEKPEGIVFNFDE